MRRPTLYLSHILAWADAYFKRQGHWPTLYSGPIPGTQGVNWRQVDSALRLGLRGLPGGSSLAQLLAEQRGVRNLSQLPQLTIKQILIWADEHHRQTGIWPHTESGTIRGSDGEKWKGIDYALRVGTRGLRGGSSLSQLLARYRGVRNIQQLPRLTTRQILAWADAHHERTGTWSTSKSGQVAKVPGETWSAINAALRLGRRGLPGGSSLARLLAAHRGVRNPKQLPRLSVKQVLTWAREHRRRTGEWPTRTSGPIPGTNETWSAINAALMMGCRGLPTGLTLRHLFRYKKAESKEPDLPRLSLKRILAWADAYRRRTGAWPHSRSGPIPESPGETWRAVDQALRKNQRGLKISLSLVQLLVHRRGLRSRMYAPTLTEEQVLTWARAHHDRTGAWPNFRSGPIPESPGETWRAVDSAVRQGFRGMPGGISLARLLAEKGGVRNRASLPPLKVKHIIAWAKVYRRRTGKWPSAESGSIPESPGETWKSVEMALRGGYRGLPGGSSLHQVLEKYRKKNKQPVA
jgi:hypothetical protein